MTERHLEIPQFFCPSAFDLSFYGSADDVEKKTLFLDVRTTDDQYIEGKHIAMLINTRDIQFFDDYEQVQLYNFTRMIWMPLSSKAPQSSIVTFTNHEFFKKETEYDSYSWVKKGKERMEWISVDKEYEAKPYTFPLTQPSVKGQVLFQTSHDMFSTVHRSDKIFAIDIVGLVGGALCILVFILSLWFKLWVSWLMHLTIVRNLFRVDPAQAKKPKSKQAMERKDPRQLLQEARTVARKRVNMTRTACDRFVLLFEALIAVITCKATKFGKILAQGKQEIKDDLNVYNIM